MRKATRVYAACLGLMLMASMLTGCGTAKTESKQAVSADVVYEKLFEMFLLDNSNYQVKSKEPGAVITEQQEKRGDVIREEGMSKELDCQYVMCDEGKEELDTIEVCVPEGRFYFATSEGALIAEGVANADISDKTGELAFSSAKDAVSEVQMILEEYAGISLPEEVEVYGLDQAYCASFGEEANQECYVIWFGEDHEIQAIYSPEGVELIKIQSEASGTN